MPLKTVAPAGKLNITGKQMNMMSNLVPML